MKFYITFGCCHIFANNWVEVEAEDATGARKLTSDALGNKWSGIYDEEEFAKARKSFPDGRIGRVLK